MFFIGFAVFLLDCILAIVISVVIDVALYVPIALLWALFGTGLITLLFGVISTACMSAESAEDFIRSLPLRILGSCISAAYLLYGGITLDKLFFPGFIETDRFVPFLIVSIVVCMVIYIGHWLLTRWVCQKIADHHEKKQNEWLQDWEKRPHAGISHDEHVSTWEEQYNKELEKFNDIVENQ